MPNIAPIKSDAPPYVHVEGRYELINARIANTAPKSDDVLAIRTALAMPEYCGMEIAYDTFSGNLMLAEKPGAWVTFADDHYTQLACNLAESVLDRYRFEKRIPKDMLRDVVWYQGKRNAKDMAVEWARGLTWDKTKRVDTFLEVYFGAIGDKAYLRAVSRYLWTALAGRLLKPGTKADMAPVAYGGQGVGKTTTIAAICPAPEQFLELSFDMHKLEDTARQLQGTLVVELAELAGMSPKVLQAFKSFMSSTHDSWVPKWKEFKSVAARRCVFFGSTNEDAYLDDPTGARRFLPFEATICQPDKLAADREQLWAEAIELFLEVGVEYAAADKLAGGEREKYRVVDEWEQLIVNHLDNRVTDNPDFVTISAALSALGVAPERQDITLQKRVGKILRGLGWKAGTARVCGVSTRGYKRKT